MMTTDWWDIAPLGWENILVCLVCGTLVGLERQLRGKPVGIRTSSLIILGTYCFLAIGAAVSPRAPIRRGYWASSSPASAFSAPG